MRFNSYVNGSYGFAGINVAGGALNLPLKIQLAPTSALDAVNRSYVNTAVTAIIGSSITGVFAAARLPSYTGADVSSPGVGVFTLSNTGVTAATYAKVTVDNKGRVTTGQALVSGDVPNLSYTKLIDRPTTLAGYGITDVVSMSGSTMTGPLVLNGVPTDPTHLVSKAYVDTRVGGSGGSAFVTGDIISKSSSTTPSGFLRCNGGAVSKTTYAPLFSLLGYTYNKIHTPNSGGQPWVMQYDFNTTQSSDITGWVTTAPLPSGLQISKAIVTKNRVYLLGGFTTTTSSIVFTAPINTDGTLGAWTTYTSLPAAFIPDAVIMTVNRIYLFSSNVYYSSIINSDGTLGTWSAAFSLPASINGGKVIATSTRVYIIGGIINGARIASVYTAPINTDGSIGAWTVSTPTPEALYYHNCIVTFNRVYILGGSQTDGTQISRVYTAVINADGTLGAWGASTALPATIQLANEIVTGNRAYLIAGQVGGSASNLVYTAPILANGTLGAWTTGTSLPNTATYAQAVVTSSRIYVLGGTVNGISSSIIYSATFSGGSNDYTMYTTLVTTASTDFTLPDFSLKETPGFFSYIKF